MDPANHINIGSIEGPILIFGGPYSNIHALEALQELCFKRDIPVGNVFCTGDIAGYCAFPDECIACIREWGIHCIAGNVEEQLRSGAADCGCNFSQGGRCDRFSQNWYQFALNNTSTLSIDWLRTLPSTLAFDYYQFSARVLHGSFSETAEFIFESTAWEKKERIFNESDSDLIFAGHSGIPFHHSKNGKHWFNAGVIGMPPNDGTHRVWYLTLSPEKDVIHYQFQHFDYDRNAAYAAMIASDLPTTYAESLKTGLWDNCEILPSRETAQQGIPCLLPGGKISYNK